MEVQHLPRRKFADMIGYLHSESCELTVFTQQIDCFKSKMSGRKYVVIKDTQGIAAAYAVEDRIVLPEEE